MPETFSAPDAGRPNYGWPNVLDADSRGTAIEDVFPSLYIGAERAGEMARKARELPWAARAVARWRAEAEQALKEEPRFSRAPTAGRCNMMGKGSGLNLGFDPAQPERTYIPATGEWRELDAEERKGWGILQHERTRRLMTSLGFLYRLTGDERYSRWVWSGLRNSVADLYAPERLPDVGESREKKYTLVYGGLYEAQAQLQLLQAFELVDGAPGSSDEVREGVRTHCFQAAAAMLSRWLNVMIVHNMSCWADAALARLGKHLNEPKYVEQALTGERAGLRLLLTRGAPRDERTGKPDGFWFETAAFYHFYALIPIVGLMELGEAEGMLDADLRERFAALFEGPWKLADPELRMLTVGDRASPGRLSLTQFRHAYEYAAGRLDPERYGPLLALLYERCGASRDSLAALAFGPDELPAPARLEHASVPLPAARMAAFRGQTGFGPMNLWFLGGEDNQPGQGHHHHDKLSVSVSACGEPLSWDMGLPGACDTDWAQFLNGVLSHNTLMLDEIDQGPMKSLAFESGLDAPVPWARAVVEGDRTGYRQSLWKVCLRRGDAVQEGVYDGAKLERTVYFRAPLAAFSDRVEAPAERRAGFVFHARGELLVAADEAPGSKPLDLPAPRETGAWRLFVQRRKAEPLRHVEADWRIQANLWLRLCATCDAPFEAHWGRTPGNPSTWDRGTLLLRAAGASRRFGAVLEIHRGTPSVKRAELDSNGTVRAVRYEGEPLVFPAQA
ncbi:MAG: heparinase II/III-family protein [Planctomycetota bacterium]|nr:heparinase II/III-family protein [Planctomycetota bacterium]